MLAEGLRRPRRSGRLFTVSAGLSLAVFTAAAAAQSDRYAFEPDAVELDHPAVAYRLASRTDAVSLLDEKLRAGTATLTFDPGC